MKYKELEFKYNASTLSLVDFQEFCQTKGPSKVSMASGWDYFYSSSEECKAFYRLRKGEADTQLTFKRKTVAQDSFLRVEHNVNLDKDATFEDVSAYVQEFGYTFNCKIFKNCFIFKYDTYTLVYYVCYDETMNELGRFIEIEMDEKHPWACEKDAWSDLVALERICGKALGTSPSKRIKHSLFELYRTY